MSGIYEAEKMDVICCIYFEKASGENRRLLSAYFTIFRAT